MKHRKKIFAALAMFLALSVIITTGVSALPVAASDMDVITESAASEANAVAESEGEVSEPDKDSVSDEDGTPVTGADYAAVLTEDVIEADEEAELFDESESASDMDVITESAASETNAAAESVENRTKPDEQIELLSDSEIKEYDSYSWHNDVGVFVIWDDAGYEQFRPDGVNVTISYNDRWNDDEIVTQTTYCDPDIEYTYEGNKYYSDGTWWASNSEMILPDEIFQPDTVYPDSEHGPMTWWPEVDCDGYEITLYYAKMAFYAGRCKYAYNIVVELRYEEIPPDETPCYLTVTKEVSDGDTGNGKFTFQIYLEKDGEPYEGEYKAVTSQRTGEDRGTANPAQFKLRAGDWILFKLEPGVTWTVTETIDRDMATTSVYVDGELELFVGAGNAGTAKAVSGTIEGSTQVTFVNSFREYYDINEEIVVEEGDRETWVKSESVNEHNAIELEMSTYLPTIPVDDLAEGSFTMNFHDVLDSELVLDETETAFSVYIGGEKISSDYYTISLASASDAQAGDGAIDDGCSFHVDVDLSALYNDGIVTEEMLDGSTEIMIFFYADLEGTGLNGSYTSTVWYQVFDADELLYTSSTDVVAVYTYEVRLLKYDAATLTGEDYDSVTWLPDAVFGVYEDAACSEPVSRNGEPYTVTTDEEGRAVFYGLAEGTYYVTEIEAPDGYARSDEVLEVVLGDALNDSGYTFEAVYANTPEEEDDTSAGEIPVGSTENPSGGEGEPLIGEISDYNQTSGSDETAQVMAVKTGDPNAGRFYLLIGLSALGVLGVASLIGAQKMRSEKRR